MKHYHEIFFIVSTLHYQQSQSYHSLSKRFISKFTNRIFQCNDNKDSYYELIDCGNYKRLERFGPVIISRSCPTASWGQALPTKTWKQATLSYNGESGKSGTWVGIDKVPTNWTLILNDIKFNLAATAFGQIGVFPEQKENWVWIQSQIKQRVLQQEQELKDVLIPDTKQRELRILNGFGYTGSRLIHI